MNTPSNAGYRVEYSAATNKLHVIGGSREVVSQAVAAVSKDTGLSFSKVLRSPGSGDFFSLASL